MDTLCDEIAIDSDGLAVWNKETIPEDDIPTDIIDCIIWKRREVIEELLSVFYTCVSEYAEPGQLCMVYHDDDDGNHEGHSKAQAGNELAENCLAHILNELQYNWSAQERYLSRDTTSSIADVYRVLMESVQVLSWIESTVPLPERKCHDMCNPVDALKAKVGKLYENRSSAVTQIQLGHMCRQWRKGNPASESDPGASPAFVSGLHPHMKWSVYDERSWYIK